MKKILWLLLPTLGFFYLFPAWGGSLTGNGFICRPNSGAQGIEGKNAFDAGLNRVDERLGKEIWVGDPNYGSTLQSAITAIGVNNRILRIPAGICNVSENLSVPENITIRVERGAVFSIANGKTLTIQGELEAGPYQIFSWTGTGAVKLGNYVEQVLPEWYGAKPDGVTDSGNALRKAFTTLNAAGTGYKNVKLLPGEYIISTGQLLFGSAEYMAGYRVTGAGVGEALKTGGSSTFTGWSNGTILQFNDTTIDSCVKIDAKNAYISSLVFKGFAVSGPGKTAGTNIHGIWLTNTGAAPGGNSLDGSTFEDIIVGNVSGTGFRALKLWDSVFKGVAAVHCGGNGLMVSGNVINIGTRYTMDIDGVGLWIVDGTAIIDRWNSGNCGYGARFGCTQADKIAESLPDWFVATGPASTASRAYGIIGQFSVEPAYIGGIAFGPYSNFVSAGNIAVFSAAGHTLDYGIKLASPVTTGILFNLPDFNTSLGGSFTNTFYCDYVSPIGPQGSLIILTRMGDWKTKIMGAVGSAVHTVGAGLNDLTSAGAGTKTATAVYTFKLSTAASPDKFQWKKDAGSYSSEITIVAGAKNNIDSSFTIAFAAATGHTLNDEWTVTVNKSTIGGDSPGVFIPLQNAYGSVTASLQGADAGCSALLGGPINLTGDPYYNYHDTTYKAGDLWFSGNGLQIAKSGSAKIGIYQGNGSPEGAVTAPPGSFYLNNAGGAGATMYVKESGTGNTGWVAK